jgi:hypothetical protein
MVKCLYFLAFGLFLITANANVLKITGQTEYTQQQTKTLITSINAEYRITIYEPSHKFWLVYLGGKISPDYDLFGNELKTNVFTTLGVDF